MRRSIDRERDRLGIRVTWDTKKLRQYLFPYIIFVYIL